MMSHAVQAGREERFRFGDNGSRFLSALTREKILGAVTSLKETLGVVSLEGATFLAAGSRSGLFSVAAVRLASVRAYV